MRPPSPTLRSRLAACLGLVYLLASVGCGPTGGSDSSDAVAPAAPVPVALPTEPVAGFTPQEIALLRSLSLETLSAPPPVPSNPVADRPEARALGHALFFDARLSRDAAVRCADCHRPELDFSDGRPQSVGVGRGTRNAPVLLGIAHATWFFVDGRRDSLWSQALTPIEAGVEMAGTRLEAARLVTTEPRYRAHYEALFGEAPDLSLEAGLPERAGPYAEPEARAAWQALTPDEREVVNRVFANLGRTLAAYQRLLEPAPGRFDRFVALLVAGDGQAALATLDDDERAGLRLFIDAERGRCLRCHNGPLLTNQVFHDIGTSRLGDVPDLGRFLGAQALLLDEFNCLGPYSGVQPEQCGAIRFMDRSHIGESAGAFKTPTLRGLARSAPYFHSGTVPSLAQVIEHYRKPPEGLRHELEPLDLSDAEALQLERFLLSLGGGTVAGSEWLGPPAWMH